jgi:hypothetical protein
MSFLNNRTNLEQGSYQWMRNPGIENLAFNNFTLINEAIYKNYKVRVSEVPNKYAIDYFNTRGPQGMLSRIGKFTSREEMLNSVPDRCLDIWYDLYFHDEIFHNTKNTRADRDRLLLETFDHCSNYMLNYDSFKNYDTIIFLSDHGYADYNSDTNYFEHEGYDGLMIGSPYQHAHPILFILEKDGHGIHNEYDLISQVDISTYIRSLLREKPINLYSLGREYLVTFGYYSENKNYPVNHHIVYHNNTFLSINVNKYYEGEPNDCHIFDLDTNKILESDHRLTRLEWDILYNESPFLDKQFHYKEIKCVN